MHLCIFNPEHDLCLAKGRANYVPPRSAVDFAVRDARIMATLYPGAQCFSVYDAALPEHIAAASRQAMHRGQPFAPTVVAWGWNAVVKHELLKRGIPEASLPTDAYIATIRRLQHRTTIAPLQPDCHAVYTVGQMQTLLQHAPHWVMKAPWSGAGRGLRWVHGQLTPIDIDWINKTVAKQQCIVAEPRRDVVADLALEYRSGVFVGYSLFRTSSGVYKNNIPITDAEVEQRYRPQGIRATVEEWLACNVWPQYHGPLGVDTMLCTDGNYYISEINLRHTMGMVAHQKYNAPCL